MAKGKTQDLVEYMSKDRIADGANLIQQAEADSNSQKNLSTANKIKSQCQSGLGELLLRSALAVGIALKLVGMGGLESISNMAYAQTQQEQAKKEQIDERDFAKHGEIDYRGVNLWANRLPPTPPYLPPDYDPFTEKVVFCANIGNKDYGEKLEVFIADMMIYKDEKGVVRGIANPRTQKRLTWDAEPDIYNVNAFFTKDRSVAYSRTYQKESKKPEDNDFFIITDISNDKKRKISYKKFIELYQKIHKNGQIVAPPSN